MYSSLNNIDNPQSLQILSIYNDEPKIEDNMNQMGYIADLFEKQQSSESQDNMKFFQNNQEEQQYFSVNNNNIDNKISNFQIDNNNIDKFDLFQEDDFSYQHMEPTKESNNNSNNNEYSNSISGDFSGNLFNSDPNENIPNYGCLEDNLPDFQFNSDFKKLEENVKINNFDLNQLSVNNNNKDVDISLKVEQLSRQFQQQQQQIFEQQLMMQEKRKSSFQINSFEINLHEQLEIEKQAQISEQKAKQQEKENKEKEAKEQKKQQRLKRNYIWFYYYNYKQDLMKNLQFQRCHKDQQSLKKLQNMMKNENISSHEKLKKLCQKLKNEQQKELLEDFLCSIAYWIQGKLLNVDGEMVSFLEYKIRYSDRLKLNKDHYRSKIPKYLQDLEAIFQQYLG